MRMPDQLEGNVWGAETPSDSRRTLVFVNQSAQTVATFHRERLRPRPRRRGLLTVRRRQCEAAMRPPSVVMINEDREHSLQMRCVYDQRQSSHSDRAVLNEPLRNPIRLGDLNRRPNDSDVFGLEHSIEAAHKLPIVVADQRANRFCLLGKRPGHLPRLLRHPLGVRVRRAPSQVHSAAADFDEEEDVQPQEPDAIDGEEIHRDEALRLRAQELTSRHPPALSRGSELLLPENLLDGSRRHDDPHALQLADDARVAPPRVFAGQPHDQRSNARVDRRSTGRSGIGPANQQRSSRHPAETSDRSPRRSGASKHGVRPVRHVLRRGLDGG